MKFLITAGPTREKIDSVRFITNHSSGKMGYALAGAALDMGHEVTLVAGPVSLTEPLGVKLIKVESADEMARAVKKHFSSSDVTIMAAAVADYRPAAPVSGKIKKKEGNLVLDLERTEDILKSLGKIKKDSQLLVGFAAETSDLEKNALKKLKDKNLDWIAANNVSQKGQGFQSDNNAVVLYSRDGKKTSISLANKRTVAKKIITAILSKEEK